MDMGSDRPPQNEKIVCTLEPASTTIDQVKALAQAGMSVARLNASHETVEERAGLVDRVRAVDAAIDRSLAVIIDIPGPEVRTAPLSVPITIDEGSGTRSRGYSDP